MNIQLDLTSWARGPHTGVGLSALNSFLALRALAHPDLQVAAVSRDRVRAIPPFPLQALSVWEKLGGKRRVLFHGFDNTLPRLARSPKVLTVHDLWTLRGNPYQDRSYQRRQSGKLRTAIARAAKIITPTHAVRDELVAWDGTLSDRVYVVPWAPLIEDLSREPQPEELTAYLAEGRPFLLSVACLEVRKNLSTLFAALHGRRDLDLVLVGSLGFGAERVLRDLESLKDSGTRCLHFRGLASPSLRLLYRDCLALVQPSLEEGFGIPVVEGLYHGRPCLLSRIPPLVEIAGEAALYFTLSDGAPALRSQIDRLARDPDLRETHGRLARERALRYSWQETARRLVKVYLGGSTDL